MKHLISLGILLSFAGLACSSNKPTTTQIGDATSDSEAAPVEIGTITIDAGKPDTYEAALDTAEADNTILVGFDGEVNEANECAGTTIQTVRKPPVVLFLIDRSLSMSNLPDDTSTIPNNYFPSSVPQPAGTSVCQFFVMDDAQYALTKYGKLRATLDTIFSPGQLQQDWQVAMTFFTAPGHVPFSPGYDTTNPLAFCDVGLYTTPTIALDTVANNHGLVNCWTGYNTSDPRCGPLTSQSTIQELNADYCTSGGAGTGGYITLPPLLPQGDTPMASALDGAVQYMTALQNDSLGNPLGGARRIVILITDGDPNPTAAPCAPLSGVVNAANVGYNSNPRIYTYTIGVPGSTEANLQKVALAGGGLNFTIDAQNYNTELATAFAQIAQESKTCSFDVPPPANSSDIVDPSSVIVQFVVGNTTVNVPRDITDVAGWDYTSGGAQITLFGSFCEAVNDDPQAKLNILAGCLTSEQIDTGPGCQVQGSECSGEGTCCLGYHCDSTSSLCYQNIVIVNQ